MIIFLQNFLVLLLAFSLFGALLVLTIAGLLWLVERYGEWLFVPLPALLVVAMIAVAVTQSGVRLWPWGTP